MKEIPETPEGQIDRVSIPKLRRVVLWMLLVAVALFTVGVFLLARRIFDNFGPGVRDDLAWKTVRGAHELARAAELGFALADAKMITTAFGDYRSSDDVVAIVGADSKGQPLVTHGRSPVPHDVLFQGAPGKLRALDNHYVCWAPSHIEQAEVGRVALVISKRRLVDSARLLSQVQLLTGGAGLLALCLGVLIINHFTNAVARRDQRLAAYAQTLEAKVAARTSELAHANQSMRLVLDNVSQGLVSIDGTGRMDSERSAVLAQWLGEPPGSDFIAWLARTDATTAESLRMGLEALAEDLLPVELILDQMPRSLAVSDRELQLSYTPIADTQGCRKLLVVISDVTAERAHQRAEQERREMGQLYHHVMKDRRGFQSFLREGERLVSELTNAELPPTVQKRHVHTLKGNCALFGLQSVANLCHDIETAHEDGGALTDVDRVALKRSWGQVLDQAQLLLGGRDEVLEVEMDEFRALLAQVERRRDHASLALTLRSWTMEPVADRLTHLAHQARDLARRLGKPALQVEVDGGGVRLPAERFDAFWASLVHVVRNAVDHGIEPPPLRLERGKPGGGVLGLSARLDGRDLVVQVRDDGGGIDWASVAARAARAGLPHGDVAALTDALFTDGISTRDQASAVSGRGFGLAATRATVASLGGSTTLRTEPLRGTTFEFRLPVNDAVAMTEGQSPVAAALH